MFFKCTPFKGVEASARFVLFERLNVHSVGETQKVPRLVLAGELHQVLSAFLSSDVKITKFEDLGRRGLQVICGPAFFCRETYKLDL